MKTQRITDEEIKANGVSGLPTRPNAPLAFGGKGMSAEELKEAFDALPALIAQRLNLLIDDISGENGGSIADAIPTGVFNGHTLEMLFEDLKNGEATAYIATPWGTLLDTLHALRQDVNAIASHLGLTIKEEI